jgi:hypothetical protein
MQLGDEVLDGAPGRQVFVQRASLRRGWQLLACCPPGYFLRRNAESGGGMLDGLIPRAERVRELGAENLQLRQADSEDSRLRFAGTQLVRPRRRPGGAGS